MYLPHSYCRCSYLVTVSKSVPFGLDKEKEQLLVDYLSKADIMERKKKV